MTTSYIENIDGAFIKNKEVKLNKLKGIIKYDNISNQEIKIVLQEYWMYVMKVDYLQLILN